MKTTNNTVNNNTTATAKEETKMEKTNRFAQIAAKAAKAAKVAGTVVNAAIATPKVEDTPYDADYKKGLKDGYAKMPEFAELEEEVRVNMVNLTVGLHTFARKMGITDIVTEYYRLVQDIDEDTATLAALKSVLDNTGAKMSQLVAQVKNNPYCSEYRKNTLREVLDEMKGESLFSTVYAVFENLNVRTVKRFEGVEAEAHNIIVRGFAKAMKVVGKVLYNAVNVARTVATAIGEVVLTIGTLVAEIMGRVCRSLKGLVSKVFRKEEVNQEDLNAATEEMLNNMKAKMEEQAENEEEKAVVEEKAEEEVVAESGEKQAEETTNQEAETTAEPANEEKAETEVEKAVEEETVTTEEGTTPSSPIHEDDNNMDMDYVSYINNRFQPLVEGLQANIKNANIVDYDSATHFAEENPYAKQYVEICHENGFIPTEEQLYNVELMFSIDDDDNEVSFWIHNLNQKVWDNHKSEESMSDTSVSDVEPEEEAESSQPVEDSVPVIIFREESASSQEQKAEMTYERLTTNVFKDEYTVDNQPISVSVYADAKLSISNNDDDMRMAKRYIAICHKAGFVPTDGEVQRALMLNTGAVRYGYPLDDITTMKAIENIDSAVWDRDEDGFIEEDRGFFTVEEMKTSIETNSLDVCMYKQANSTIAANELVKKHGEDILKDRYLTYILTPELLEISKEYVKAYKAAKASEDSSEAENEAEETLVVLNANSAEEEDDESEINETSEQIKAKAKMFNQTLEDC